jgi:hypothetical protein
MIWRVSDILIGNVFGVEEFSFKFGVVFVELLNLDFLNSQFLFKNGVSEVQIGYQLILIVG